MTQKGTRGGRAGLEADPLFLSARRSATKARKLKKKIEAGIEVLRERVLEIVTGRFAWLKSLISLKKGRGGGWRVSRYASTHRKRKRRRGRSRDPGGEVRYDR